jgi:hypothetical protein
LLSTAFNTFSHDAKAQFPNDIARRISFSPIISRCRRLPLAFYRRPTQKQRVSNDNKDIIIKNISNKKINESNTLGIPAQAENLYTNTNKRGTDKTAVVRAIQ